MKVDGQNSSIQLSAYLNQIRNQQGETNSNKQTARVQPEASDKVQFSKQALEVQQANQMLKELPEIRSEMVEQTKMAVDQGTYNVSGEKVANDMMRESFQNNMILHSIDTRV